MVPSKPVLRSAKRKPVSYSDAFENGSDSDSSTVKKPKRPKRPKTSSPSNTLEAEIGTVGNVVIRTKDGQTLMVIKEILSFLSRTYWGPKIEAMDMAYRTHGPSSVETWIDGRPVLESEDGKIEDMCSVLALWSGGLGCVLIPYIYAYH